MTPTAVNAILWLVAIVAVLVLFARQRRRRGHVGSAAAGSVYDMLNEDKRNAVEIVVEERAGARILQVEPGGRRRIEDLPGKGRLAALAGPRERHDRPTLQSGPQRLQQAMACDDHGWNVS